ncbi:MAG: hypothetical protein SWK90_05240 [Chloroflexota bacterium]|nr:hypothetical protein [Chloroflexota bacterium]
MLGFGPRVEVLDPQVLRQKVINLILDQLDVPA